MLRGSVIWGVDSGSNYSELVVNLQKMRGLVCGLKNLKNVQVNLSNKSGKNKNNKNINLYQGARAHLFKNKVPGGNWGEMKDCPDNRKTK